MQAGKIQFVTTWVTIIALFWTSKIQEEQILKVQYLRYNKRDNWTVFTLLLGNYWRVDVEKIFEDKLRRQNTSVSRNVQAGFTYASDLQDVFFMKTGKIRRKTSIELTVSTGITPLLLQQISDMPGETLEFFSEDDAPTIQEVIESLKSDENSSNFAISPFRKRKSPFNQTPEIPSMPPQSLFPQYSSSFNPFSSPLFQQYLPQVKSSEPVYASFNQKPPFTTAALTIFAFMASKQESVTGWHLAEKVSCCVHSKNNALDSELLSILEWTNKAVLLTFANHGCLDKPTGDFLSRSIKNCALETQQRRFECQLGHSKQDTSWRLGRRFRWQSPRCYPRIWVFALLYVSYKHL